MPGTEPPTFPCSANLLDLIRLCGWESGHLLTPHGAKKWLNHPNGEWQTTSNEVRQLSEDTFFALCVGEAQPDGSFVSGGKTWKLGDDGAFAVLVG